ncbi:ABC transporter [Permianibacter sp. IMCC34836]|uniref:Gldg family protein n=1 Tax=Permianibacter fluminis TaxID=2738515 RepID=UPI001552D656|nr:Gldg family protein [Permianibacter fluminis]NQD36988.1 ABC transporter [Permianibacter fluminis]
MTNKNLFSRAGLMLLALAFVALSILSTLIMRGWRIDLTENQLFSVSEGTERIVGRISEPVHLSLFFSDQESKSQPELQSLRTYAQRVRELLQEYERIGKGKIVLSLVDPVPFSEDEDRAAQLGLQAVPVADRKIYFGLVGSNSVDEKEIIAFLQPDKEQSLEYDISRMLTKLSRSEPPKVGLLSGLPVNGGFDMMSREPKPTWVVFEQIKQLFRVEDIASDATSLPSDLNLLVVVQPKGLSEPLRYAIDQYVLNGGKLLLFVDPFAETDRMPAGPQNPFPQVLPGDDLNSLLQAWGVKVDMNQILADADHALSVQTGAGGNPVRHLGLLGLDGNAAGNNLTNGLEAINVGSAGVIETLPEAKSTVTPVLVSGSHSMLMPRAKFEFLPDPTTLQKEFVSADKVQTIAAHITGSAHSAFAAAPAGVSGEHRSDAVDTGINVLLIADTDLLSDRFWVQVQDFFGQRVAQPFADNGNFVFNSVEQFADSSDLIGLRSRGRFARPFDKLDELRRDAETKFRVQEEALQQRLNETEQKLSDLQKRMNESGTVQLNPQEEQALRDFQGEKLRIRKELRDVQHQLNRDIEALGTKLKLINIALVPLLLIALATFIALGRRSARSRKARD